MSRPATLNPQTSQERFNALIGQIADLYGTKRFDRTADVTASLQKHFELAKKDNSVEAFVGLVDDIFTERKEAIKECSITARRLVEMDAPLEKASVKEYLNQKKAPATKKQDEKIVYLTKPSLDDRREAMFDGMRARDKLSMNKARLENVMENGIDLEERVKRKLLGITSENPTYKEMIGHAAGTIGKGLATMIHKGSSQLGKGIYSSTDAADLQYVESYNQRRLHLASQLRSRIDPNRSNYSQLMQRIMSKIDSSNETLDIASYNKMQDLLLEEIKKDEEEFKKRMDKFDADSKDLANSMMDDMQGHADNSDERWKHRAMSLFLVFTPLGAFSIMGHVFNYLDPLKEIFGPLFEANKGLGEGFGDVITNRKYFGFLGELMDKMEIDKAIEGVFKLPIISEFSDLVEVLKDSEIGQNMMAELAPTIAGSAPLVLGGIAATNLLAQVAPELDHSKALNASKEKHTKALKDAFKAFEEDLAKGWEKKNSDGITEKHAGTNGLIKDFVDKKYQALREGDIDAKMCQFFLDNVGQRGVSPLFNKAFKGLVDNFQNGEFDDNAGTPNVNSMLKFLKGDKSNRAEMDKLKAEARGNFLTLGAIDKGVIKNGQLTKKTTEIEQEFDLLNTKSREAVKVTQQKEVQEKFNQNFYFDIARARDMAEFTFDKEGAAKIEEKIKKEEVEKLKKDLVDIKHFPPSTQPSPKSASMLYSSDKQPTI